MEGAYLVLSCDPERLVLNLLANLLKVGEPLRQMQELGIVGPRLSAEFILACEQREIRARQLGDARRGLSVGEGTHWSMTRLRECARAGGRADVG